MALVSHVGVAGASLITLVSSSSLNSIQAPHRATIFLTIARDA